MKDGNKHKMFVEMRAMHKELEKLKAIMLQYEEDGKKLKDQLESLTRILDQTINALALAIQMRDPYTALHQRQVTDLVCAIAEELDFAPERLKGLEVASALHDIGKIGIPLDILIKPGKITELEYSLIKEHSKVGYNILKEIKFPWPVAQIVLQHHERIDGSGYPAGLRCNDILLEAKIIAVADVVEAMTSHRPYRSSLGLDMAINEITCEKGQKFDPEVVDACLKVFANKSFHFI